MNVSFIVKDTGIGIPTDKLESLFQPFVQADNSITRKYGGTGLGLAIVKSLVKMMGGEISVRSEEGRGTEFVISMKFKKAQDGIDPQGNPLRFEELKGRTALVLDDNEVARRRSLFLMLR